jgi:isopentenyl-diphosphate Delta-isomerase
MSINDNMVFLSNERLCDKLQAHKIGLQHYAYSVFVFNDKKQLLLQKRAYNKYHSGGLWSNTCCSHPLTNKIEDVQQEAEKRLFIEMGIRCHLKFMIICTYNVRCGNLVENEIDYLFIGISNCVPIINKQEVETYRWESISAIKIDIINNSSIYSGWFKIIINNNYIMGS